MFTDTDHSVNVLDHLRALGEIAEDLAEQPPPGWTREELAALGWFATNFYRRLFAAAPADVQHAYLKQQSEIG